MIPANNPEKWVERHGDLWYLRDFDYLPAQLKYCTHNISEIFMRAVGEFGPDRHFDIFVSKEDAQAASNIVRKTRGMKELF